MKKNKLSREKSEKKGGRLGLIIFSTLVILIALIPIIDGIENLIEKEGAITMNLSMSGFSTNEITAKAGEPFKVYLVNLDNQYHGDGGGWHQFASDDANFNFQIAPLDEGTVTIVIDKPGVYEFYCDICCGGKENPSMQGIIIVI
ncbi:MAG: cupredoxin domain-containing protein [Erysipelotrichaceae bacterium]|nr:cupredoxin domain-containing protein [Erysipelotrichaceae bacterium]MDP3305850.1 cupredoxin domain-containing protein [Erysipelotrichaceae bacterium]